MRSINAGMAACLLLAGWLLGGCDAEQRRGAAADSQAEAQARRQDAAEDIRPNAKKRPGSVRASRMTKMAVVAKTVPVRKPLDAGAVRRFAEAFRALCSGEDVTADRIAALAREHLGSDSFADVAGSLCAMMADGTADDRRAALAVLSALRREWTVAGTAGEPASDAASAGDVPADAADAATSADATDAEAAQDEAGDAPVEFDDVEERATMAMMTMCLSDDDPDVRDSAYETLATLPDGERTALSLQLLGNDDSVLKEALLEETRNATDEFSLTLNFHGLDAEEKCVREMAAANILEKTGKTFSSTEEAFEWYESQLNADPAAQPDGQALQPFEQAPETP